MNLTSKQQILFDFLKSKSVDNLVKMTNAAIAQELATSKLYLPAPKYSAVSVMLSRLVEKGVIKLQAGNTTRERVIRII